MLTNQSRQNQTQARYIRAKQLIPGGVQLLSKRPEMFAPDLWPCYYRSAKGCRITDLDGVTYRDFSSMAIGACLLGYACDEVDHVVIDVIRRGSMSSLNSPDEVDLAELLLEIHPWAQKVRYARSGGEAMAVAVRLARATTGRSRVAICGYHGWHDWYLAANLSTNDALNGHLLPGLSPNGVPRELTGTALTFRYNHIEELKAIIETHPRELAAVVMEPMRYDPPQNNFLQEARKLATQQGAVLIFDEITAGWRHVLGGIHLLFPVQPDMAVFAKATSNGYPMAAVIGRSSVMDAAHSSFISSTYWTEAIGPAAALATIRTMRKLNIVPTLTANAKCVIGYWHAAAAETHLPIKIIASSALCSFSFELGEDANAAKTLFTQLMLERNFLASTAYYANYAHHETDMHEYEAAVRATFAEIKHARETKGIKAALRGPEAHVGFRRLT